jgi:hypothetical protein
MEDTRNDRPIIDPPSSRMDLRQVRLNRRPGFIRQPKQRLRHPQSLHHKAGPHGSSPANRINSLIGF